MNRRCGNPAEVNPECTKIAVGTLSVADAEACWCEVLLQDLYAEITPIHLMY